MPLPVISHLCGATTHCTLLSVQLRVTWRILVPHVLISSLSWGALKKLLSMIENEKTTESVQAKK